MVVEALRGVVRAALQEAATWGLDGEHYYLIEFSTQHPEVLVPPFLRDLYPERMLVVLQHQFWHLEADDDGFSVTLSFSGVKNRLTIPYGAVESFSDPSAGFGLRFTPPAQEEEVAEGEPEAATTAADETALAPSDTPGGTPTGTVISFDRRRKK